MQVIVTSGMAWNRDGQGYICFSQWLLTQFCLGHLFKENTKSMSPNSLAPFPNPHIEPLCDQMVSLSLTERLQAALFPSHQVGLAQSSVS